jgi:hypothetical protein
VGDHFAHQTRQRRARQLAQLEPIATLGLCGTLQHCIAFDLGTIDRKLKMEVREGVLDQTRNFPPFRINRRMTGHSLGIGLGFAPRRRGHLQHATEQPL